MSKRKQRAEDRKKAIEQLQKDIRYLQQNEIPILEIRKRRDKPFSSHCGGYCITVQGPSLDDIEEKE